MAVMATRVVTALPAVVDANETKHQTDLKNMLAKTEAFKNTTEENGKKVQASNGKYFATWEEHPHKKRPRDFEDDNDNAPTA